MAAGRFGGGADASIQDDRHRRMLDDQLDVVRIADAEPRADRSAERHHRSAACISQLARHDRIVVGVGKYDEAVGDQPFGRVQQLDRIGRARGDLVGDHLELDPVRSPVPPARQLVPSAPHLRWCNSPAVLGSTAI